MNNNTKLLLLAFFGLGVIGCVGPAIAKASPADETGAGQKLYVAKCAKCHKFYDPGKYSEADWQMWMTKMGKKAKLKPEQQEVLSRYIAENLRTPARTNSAGIKALKR